MNVLEVSTPVPLIELDVLEKNLRKVMETCRTHHVAYRPHAKTHKMPVVARMQLEAGAVGITCAKLGEAEVMARAGIGDIFIAYSLVGRKHFERLANLAHGRRISVGVDSEEAASALSQYFSANGQTLDVVMEIDTGHHRCGLLPERAEEFAVYLRTLRGIRLKGIFTHEGHVYYPGTAEERVERAHGAGKQMVNVANRLRGRGMPIGVVSVGSSPARDGACQINGVTEHRPGTNIFNDCTQVHLGSCTWDDCALSYACTVVSRPAPDRAIIDGGSKTFTSDQLSDWKALGSVIGYPGAKFHKASEEHGILTLSDAQSHTLKIGDRVRVIPGHACGSINLHNRVYAVRANEIVHEWPIEARGCVD